MTDLVLNWRRFFMASEMTFEAWKKKASMIAKKLAGIDDLLDEDDPYSIEDDMLDAYEEDVPPEDFIRDVFENEVEDYEEEDEDEDDDGDLDEDLDGEDLDEEEDE